MRNNIVCHSAAKRRNLLLPLLLFLLSTASAQLPPEPPTVRIGVLSLFHPKVLILRPARATLAALDGNPVDVHPSRDTVLSADGDKVYFNDLPPGLSTGPGGDTYAKTLTLPAQTFTLTVPGKLTRTYHGALTVTARDGILIPVIAMDTELAVASIVAAESPPHAPLEALKAQAVVSRSYLLADPRTHPDPVGQHIDACDTTHCQYLRSPPPASSPAAIATNVTRHQVLTWQPAPGTPPRIVAAMYSRSCGGQTRVPTSSPDANSYPFYSVRCDYCRLHPELWSRPADGPTPETEQQRIDYNRTHGWAAIPSNTHTSTPTTIEGRGIGHGIGLCQLGSTDLAARGETFSQIVRHYFPNTALATLP